MKSFFQKLPLPAKLTLIGILPLILLLVLSWELYEEKVIKLDLIKGYISRANQSARIIHLIDNFQSERKSSYEYVMKKSAREEMMRYRKLSDSMISKLDSLHDRTILNFQVYTFLDELENTRLGIDSGRMNEESVMHYYTNMIFRLNTLNTTTPENDVYLLSVNQDLSGQKLLSEYTTYLGILRANIYNALYTGKFTQEILYFTRGVYQVFSSYEKEFLVKGSPASIDAYKKIKSSGPFHEAVSYIDTLYRTFKFDSTYTADSWWALSDSAVKEIKRFQKIIWNNVHSRIEEILHDETVRKNNTLIFLSVALLFAMTMVVYIIRIITQKLNELKVAAERISMGETGLNLQAESDDAIGSLSKSIALIDENYSKLAKAANAIGEGNFQVEVEPRSEVDVLGNAIVTMKQSLQKFTREIESLLHKKDEFMSIASHELKTPITSVKAALQIVERFTAPKEDMKDVHRFVEKASKQTTRLTNIVNDLLDVSKIQAGKLELDRSTFLARELIEESVEQLYFELHAYKVEINGDLDVCVSGDRHRLDQVVVNLLSNAIKYSPGTGKIIIKVEHTNNAVVFSFTDFGIGIEEEKLPYVFDRYFRVEQSSQNYSGLGLGLFISSEIVKRHNGHIGVRSIVGQGSTFWFSVSPGVLLN